MSVRHTHRPVTESMCDGCGRVGMMTSGHDTAAQMRARLLPFMADSLDELPEENGAWLCWKCRDAMVTKRYTP